MRELHRYSSELLLGMQGFALRFLVISMVCFLLPILGRLQHVFFSFLSDGLKPATID